MTDHESPERIRDIPLIVLNLGAKWGGWSVPRLDRFSPRKDPGFACNYISGSGLECKVCRTHTVRARTGALQV